MRAYRAEEIAEIVGGSVLAGDGSAEILRFSTDSREGDANTMFVPVIGGHVDAHKFISDAYRHGMRAVFTSRGEALPDTPGMTYVGVEDNVAALQRFGAYIRDSLAVPVIGITGSVGKTTTKEMIAAALETELVILKTEGNMNSQVGVPRMLCRLEPEHQAAVIEMGMSEPGEMEKLAASARPECAVMTNIGVSHIGQLGTKSNIRKEKLNIINEFPDGGTLFLNGDDPMLAELAEMQLGLGNSWKAMSERSRERFEKARIVTFGLGEHCDYRANGITVRDGRTVFRLHCPGDGGDYPREVALSVAGEHNVRNALAAIAVAAHYGVSPERAAEGLAGYKPIAMRGGKTEADGVVLIDDTYNASPDSMRGGIDILASTEAERRIAVLADMLELGELSRACHEEIGRCAAERGVDLLVAVGSEARYYAEAFDRQSGECAAAAEEPDFAAEPDFVKETSPAAELEQREESGRPADTVHTGNGGRRQVHFDTNAEALEFLKRELVRGDTVLFKGSRGMRLEELVNGILQARTGRSGTGPE
ncbi:MAG: UDP-N-acetylmuramoyl-tripeptide--D-alanyl-D-alanine ligase [Lachnospiraceae bacterium]|nr:UDP-N-acetylmuramoyl-tripeptide--D-alanyl-D-alanine ligase [Lachnospiraceae bacterium]